MVSLTQRLPSRSAPSYDRGYSSRGNDFYSERFVKRLPLLWLSPGQVRCCCRVGTMIVRHFLHWVRTAQAADRAEATRALARASLYSDLSPDDRIAAEGAMVMSLDDPSPLVRRALAPALAASAHPP